MLLSTLTSKLQLGDIDSERCIKAMKPPAAFGGGFRGMQASSGSATCSAHRQLSGAAHISYGDALKTVCL